MVRSLGLLMVVVVPIWFFAQPPDSDESELRVVDPTADIAAFATDRPRVPVPGALPDGWRATSSTTTRGPAQLRVGYVTPDGEYAEYAASEAPRDDVVEAARRRGSAGAGRRDGRQHDVRELPRGRRLAVLRARGRLGDRRRRDAARDAPASRS